MVFHRSVCLSRALGGSLLLCNVVNVGFVRRTGNYMPICSFYYKTNIVILTCTSDIFPPDLPSYLF